MKSSLNIFLTTTILLLTPYKMIHASLIKGPEASSIDFQNYIENRKSPSLVSAKIETLYSSTNKKLYTAMDNIESSPNESLKTIIENSSENTLSPNDLKFVSDLITFIKNTGKSVHPDLLKKIECRLAFNNLEKLKELNCLYIESSTHFVKKYLEQGGTIVINDHTFDNYNLPEKIYSADEKYQIHFISNTQSSYTALNFIHQEFLEFKEPKSLISGSCSNFTINDNSIISQRNKIYFSDNCIQDTFNPEKPKSWVQKHKTTLTIVGGVALIAAAIYLKDKRVVFQKQVFSF